MRPRKGRTVEVKKLLSFFSFNHSIIFFNVEAANVERKRFYEIQTSMQSL